MIPIESHEAAHTINTFAPAAFQHIQTVVEAHLGKTFPALAITIVQAGQVRLNMAWGWIDPDKRTQAVTPDTIFDLASLTKLFTTTGFLKAVSAGKISLDAPLLAIVPEFGRVNPRPIDGGQDPHTGKMLPVPPGLAGQTADPHQVTFRQLLTHTGGLAPWRAVFEETGPPPPPPPAIDPIPRAERWRRGFRAICHYPFVGQPGDGIIRYSDLGYMMLDEATARLWNAGSGHIDRVIQDHITGPLSLPSIGYVPLASGLDRQRIAPTEHDTRWRKRRCWGEVHDENAYGLGGVSGHAGLFGTARDVATFGQAWLSRDPRLGIHPVLLDHAVQEQVVSAESRRGLGWMLHLPPHSPTGSLLSLDSYGHTGYTGTSLWIDPQRALVMAVLTNRVYMGREETGIQSFRHAIHNAIVHALEET